MKHNEYFRIKELVLDLTPIDTDGEILYKFVFCLDDNHKTLRYDDIKIYIKSTSGCSNKETNFIELSDKTKKEEIIKILMKHPPTLDIMGQQMVITYQQKSLDNIIFGKNNTRQSIWQMLS